MEVWRLEVRVLGMKWYLGPFSDSVPNWVGASGVTRSEGILLRSEGEAGCPPAPTERCPRSAGLCSSPAVSGQGQLDHTQDCRGSNPYSPPTSYVTLGRHLTSLHRGMLKWGQAPGPTLRGLSWGLKESSRAPGLARAAHDKDSMVVATISPVTAVSSKQINRNGFHTLVSGHRAQQLVYFWCRPTAFKDPFRHREPARE